MVCTELAKEADASKVIQSKKFKNSVKAYNHRVLASFSKYGHIHFLHSLQEGSRLKASIKRDSRKIKGAGREEYMGKLTEKWASVCMCERDDLIKRAGRCSVTG